MAGKYSDYRQCSDDELIDRLRRGEEPIMDYICDKYKNLVRSKAKSMFILGADSEDLIQEGMIGLFKAVRDYDGGKEASFFSFAELCITRQLYKAVEASNRKKHAPLNTYISFYSETGEEGHSLAETLTTGGMGDPEQMIIDQENLKQFWDGLREHLSPMEQQVLDEYLQGNNYQQIAEHMNKQPKTIDNALQRIKTKVRQEVIR